MTRFAKRLMFAAASVAVAAGAASAQTMKAEIPFAFRVGNTTMPAGTYRVVLNNEAVATPLLHVSNDAGRYSAAAKAIVPHDAPKAWREARQPMLGFECSANQCSLVEVWGGNRNPAYRFAAPKAERNESAHAAVIALRPVGD